MEYEYDFHYSPFLAYFPYFDKMAYVLFSSLCVCMYIPLNNFGMPEPVFMKLGMYIIAPEPVLTTNS
jgi:hypothetical protein